MINLETIEKVTLKKNPILSDNSEYGYLTVLDDKKVPSSIKMSAKAVKSVGIDPATLSKDKLAYMLIYPMINNTTEDLKIEWFVGQVAISEDPEERKVQLKNTIKTERYKAYTVAKFNKGAKTFNSQTMAKILKEEFNNSDVYLEPSSMKGIFKLVKNTDNELVKPQVVSEPTIVTEVVNEPMNMETFDEFVENVTEPMIVTANAELNEVDTFLNDNLAS